MSVERVSAFAVEEAGLRSLGGYPTLAAAAALLPAGAYTTLRTYGGRGVVRLGQHLRRLEESAALQGRPGSIDARSARHAIAAALDATGHPESRVRLAFAPPRLLLAVEPFASLPTRLYADGVAAVTLEVRRENPHAKDTRFIATAQRAYERLPAGVEEGLLVAEDGGILEGLSSNVFAVVDGVLRTEEERALLGVTRSLVLEVAAGLVPVERRGVRREDLPAVAEAFLTSVSREVLPLVRVDGLRVGDGRPGPRTRAIMAGFAALVEREVEALP